MIIRSKTALPRTHRPRLPQITSQHWLGKLRFHEKSMKLHVVVTLRGRSRVGSIERDGDALSGSLEALHPMLQPPREKEQAASCRREWNAQARTHPWQINSRGFIHRNGRAARIAEQNLPALHRPRDFHVVN